MIRFLRHHLVLLLAIAFLPALVAGITSCNRYSELLGVGRPVIEFDHPDGIYTVAVGEELIISPMVENAVGASYQWMLEDSTVVCTAPVWVSRWSKPGQYYVTLVVTAEGGVAGEEIMVDVIDPQPPAISVAIPADGVRLALGSAYEISPLYGNCGQDGPQRVEWMVNGEPVSSESSYTFAADAVGIYNIVVRAWNAVGSSERTFVIEVVETLPSDIHFVPLSAFETSSRRYTVAHRPVALRIAGHYEGDISWSVDGRPIDCAGPVCLFSSDRIGSHHVVASNRGSSASIEVVVMDQPSIGTTATISSAVTVMEYLPAPGQFIGETNSVGGMPPEMDTHDAACRWAERRFAAERFVSLGAWGGYVVCRFDGSVRAHSSGYDFAVMGNAITTSNEPGIVWVMQDVNGNGLPDDEWYELRGSSFDDPQTVRGCCVTYYRPAGSAMAVQWVDALGESGVVDYIASSHSQPSYFPAWADGAELTFYGSRLPSRTVWDQATGMWDSPPFAWGYVDNLGSNIIAGGDAELGLGQWAGFRIADAVLLDGTPVELTHIDFIKVQTAVMARSGRLGELSTEVCSLRPL